MWEGRQVAVDWWRATLGDDVHYVQNVGFGSPLVIHCFVYSFLFSSLLSSPSPEGREEGIPILLWEYVLYIIHLSCTEFLLFLLSRRAWG